MDLEISQVLTQIAAFLIFLWILKRYAWGPLQKILDERKEKIQNELESIEREKMDVAKLAVEYRNKLHDIDKEAKAKIREGVREGAIAGKKIRETAEQQAAEKLSRANEEIEGLKVKAQDEMKKEMVKLSINLTEKILQKEVTPEQQNKWMDDFIREAKI